jgi:hypothetical protein
MSQQVLHSDAVDASLHYSPVSLSDSWVVYCNEFTSEPVEAVRFPKES